MASLRRLKSPWKHHVAKGFFATLSAIERDTFDYPRGQRPARFISNFKFQIRNLQQNNRGPLGTRLNRSMPTGGGLTW